VRRSPIWCCSNDDDLTYAKVRLDERSLATLIEGIGDFEDSLPRSLCWAAAWDMTRDGEMSTTDYVTLVLSGVGRETDSSVTRTLLRQAETATMLYSAPAKRDGRPASPGRGPVRAHERRRARQRLPAPAGPGIRGGRLHRRAGRSRGAVLAGSTPIEGLTIDTDLRWHLLHRSQRPGGRTRPRSTPRSHATTRQPVDGRPPRHSRRNPSGGQAGGLGLGDGRRLAAERDPDGHRRWFRAAGQEDLLRPFVAPYFQRLREIWAERTNETAQNIVIGLFPTLIPEQSTVDAADAWLAENPTRCRRCAGSSWSPATASPVRLRAPGEGRRQWPPPIVERGGPRAPIYKNLSAGAGVQRPRRLRVLGEAR
jgi:aminopeptidase N